MTVLNALAVFVALVVLWQTYFVGVPRAALHAAFALGSGASRGRIAFLPC